MLQRLDVRYGLQTSGVPRNRVIRAFVSISLPLLFSGATPPAACPVALCSCFELPTDAMTEDRVLRKLQAAEFVLLAAVADTIPESDLHPAMALLRVQRWWKGGDTDTLRVGQRRSRDVPICDYTLDSGETYILFLHRAAGGWLFTTYCSGTVRRSDVNADAILKHLGTGTAPAR